MSLVKIFIPNREEKSRNYLAAFLALGVEPVASMETVDAGEFDALVLPGGGDVAPELYGQENTGSYGIDNALDELQMACLRNFLAAGKPVLGICRGHQLMNVYFGGTLCQHIGPAARHMYYPTGDSAHPMRAVPGSILMELYGDSFVVNSAHHQAVDRVGNGLVVTGLSDDGIVEAMEYPGKPVFSVQWHPERMCFAHRREDTVDGAPVLERLIQMARDRKS